MTLKPPVYTIPVPEYQVNTEPDHAAIGAKVDCIIRQHFSGQHVVMRCLGSVEHSQLTVDQLIQTILTTGTDRYDPERRGDRYENVEGRQIDFFGLSFNVDDKIGMFEQFTWPFYHWCLKDRGFPVRVDILIVYDPTKLERVVHTYDDGRVKDDGFVFNDPKRKQDTVLAVIKVL